MQDMDMLQLARLHAWDWFARETTGHDWHHVRRVHDLAVKIAEIEGGDLTLIELAAYAHDIGDYKFHASEEAGIQATRLFLMRCMVPHELAKQVEDIAHRVSFKGRDIPDDMPTLEGKIVQDADRLDAIGAIAIARMFTYGGAHGRPIHDPDATLFYAKNAQEYVEHGKKSRSTFNHIFEKLMHLKDRLHTPTARQIAQKRHDFMMLFAEQFQNEWDGKC
ncbi:MAG TPA: HD domain-containing protein [Candidatus Paceibacterota bacterium]|nr:HD domain-containing protein [Candidatus Paceibacterota bacterium]